MGTVIRPCLGLLLLTLLSSLGTVHARDKERDTYAVRTAFRETISGALPSTVRISSKGENVAFGTIVASDGYILTKASELKGEDLACRLRDGRQLPAKLVGVRDDYDLAMLKIDASDLQAVAWLEGAAPPVGSWLATAGMDTIPIAIGVVSAAPRAIQHRVAALGVLLEESERGPKIQEVVSGSGAAKAGVLTNDVVTHLDGVRLESRQKLIDKVREHRPGDKVQLKLLRGAQEQTIEVVLGELAQLTLSRRDQIQNTIGGPLSDRRAGFPLALQHDTVLKPNQCGGPILDLDGKAVGVNIARASRVSSYAIPASVIKPLLDELKSGKLVTTRPTN